MIPIEEVYPGCFKSGWNDIADYTPMIESFGFTTLLESHDGDYQGDSRYIFKDGEMIGFLNFGWGSCSGCDSLQACSSYKAVADLRQELFDSILWFDSMASILEYFETHKWENDYSWYSDTHKAFIAKAKEYFKKGIEK